MSKLTVVFTEIYPLPTDGLQGINYLPDAFVEMFPENKETESSLLFFSGIILELLQMPDHDVVIITRSRLLWNIFRMHLAEQSIALEDIDFWCIAPGNVFSEYVYRHMKPLANGVFVGDDLKTAVFLVDPSLEVTVRNLKAQRNHYHNRKNKEGASDVTGG